MPILKPEAVEDNLKLKAEITIKRREMIDLGMTYGLLDERTIRSSRQLDELLNLYKNSRSSNHTD